MEAERQGREQQQQPSGSSLPEQAAVSDAASTRGSIYVEARLPSGDFNAVLKSAPTPEAREAWCKGDILPGMRLRLRLIETCRDELFDATQDTYREGREWWERT